MTSTSRRLAVAVMGLALTLPGVAAANADLEKLIADPNNWAMQAGDMYNQRYSKLAQINAQNVGKMQVAWMFSTGVLRGHEGSPLVVNGTMYVHTPFPNKVFADRPGHAKDQVALRAEAGRRGDTPDVLRHRVPGPRLRGEQDLPATGRQHAARTRRRNREGDLVREER